MVAKLICRKFDWAQVQKVKNIIFDEKKIYWPATKTKNRNEKSWFFARSCEIFEFQKTSSCDSARKMNILFQFWATYATRGRRYWEKFQNIYRVQKYLKNEKSPFVSFQNFFVNISAPALRRWLNFSPRDSVLIPNHVVINFFESINKVNLSFWFKSQIFKLPKIR